MSDIRLTDIKFKDLLFLDGQDGRKKNPRKIEAAALQKLAQSINDDPTFLTNRPPLVSFSDGKYLVYAGHQRARAVGQILKWKTVPCLVENDVPTETMERRAILDNVSAGEWDFSAGDWDVEIVTGWGVPTTAWTDGLDEYSTEGDNSLNGAMPDYSQKNKELTPDENEQFNITMLFCDSDYYRVKERLGELETTPEQFMLENLFPE